VTGLAVFALGWCVGVLTLMQVQVFAAGSSARRHPSQRPGPPTEWVDE